MTKRHEDDDKLRPEVNKDLYRIALEHVRYEGQLLWQIFGAFLLAHTVFMAFLLQSALDAPNSRTPGAVFWPALIGALLCIPWFATYRRSSDYYKFRMAQARAAEPDGWNFLRTIGQNFAQARS